MLSRVSGTVLCMQSLCLQLNAKNTGQAGQCCVGLAVDGSDFPRLKENASMSKLKFEIETAML